MSPTRWVVPRALSLSLLAVTLGAATASAQFFDPELRALDLSTGPVARSPRLLGMGGVSIAVPDRDASINLWDFAALPAGLAADDTSSTLDLRPGTDALSSMSRLPFGRERQNLAARTTVAQTEAVYRNHDTGSSFGVVGDLSSLRWDHPVSDDVELREGLRHPQVEPILGGTVPRILHGHLGWAAHLRFRTESVEDKYRSIVTNAAGDYISLGGSELDPPSQFAPVKTDVTTTAYGASTVYSMGQRTRLGLGLERENNRISETNDQSRSSSEIKETRPYWVGHAALVGVVGRTFEYGIDGIGRLSKSEQDWRFTTSAGVGSDPLDGRGNLLRRQEKSSEMHVRARWSPGRLVLGGSFNTAAGRIFVDPPNANDATSFNRFLNQAFNRSGADTLAFPDSVVHVESRHWAFGWGTGASYRLGRATLATEFNWVRDVAWSTLQGAGPRRIAWDIRAGLEHPIGSQLMGRVGYVHRRVDEDDYTAGNEYNGNAVSVGMGYAPKGALWSLQTGYMVEFRNTDFTDPASTHQSRQNLAAEIHWVF